jgi:hypothetical protein
VILCLLDGVWGLRETKNKTGKGKCFLCLVKDDIKHMQLISPKFGGDTDSGIYKYEFISMNTTEYEQGVNLRDNIKL